MGLQSLNDILVWQVLERSNGMGVRQVLKVDARTGAILDMNGKP
jgi:hypothetical protein